MNPFRDREIITPDDEDDIADRKAAAYEREIERGDMLRDEQRDRQMEERDEISAAHLRATPAARPPRFFRHVDGTEWEFRNGKMTVDHGEESLFSGPEELMEELDVIEVDENGNPIETDK